MPMQGKTDLFATWPNNLQFSVQRPLRDQPPPLSKGLCRGCRYQHAKMLPPNPPNCYKKTKFYFKNHQLFEILDLFITFFPLSFLKKWFATSFLHIFALFLSGRFFGLSLQMASQYNDVSGCPAFVLRLSNEWERVGRKVHHLLRPQQYLSIPSVILRNSCSAGKIRRQPSRFRLCLLQRPRFLKRCCQLHPISRRVQQSQRNQRRRLRWALNNARWRRRPTSCPFPVACLLGYEYADAWGRVFRGRGPHPSPDSTLTVIPGSSRQWASVGAVVNLQLKQSQCLWHASKTDTPESEPCGWPLREVANANGAAMVDWKQATKSVRPWTAVIWFQCFIYKKKQKNDDIALDFCINPTAPSITQLWIASFLAVYILQFWFVSKVMITVSECGLKVAPVLAYCLFENEWFRSPSIR